MPREDNLLLLMEDCSIIVLRKRETFFYESQYNQRVSRDCWQKWRLQQHFSQIKSGHRLHK